MSAATGAAAPQRFAAHALWHHGARYGALGTALAFVALPLYVTLPSHYAQRLGVPLAALGMVLLGARLLDAVIDPWLGRVADAVLARSRQAAQALAAVAAALLWGGFVALFFPPALSALGLLAWCALALTLTYLGYSTLSVLHQAWGTRLGGDARMRSFWVGWREGFALLGVLIGSALPALVGMGATAMALAFLLLLGLVALSQAPFAAGHATAGNTPGGDVWLPWRVAEFRRLLAIYMVNGIASAIPATLVLFFVRDRLQAGALEALFLALYFAAGAVSFPLWLRAIGRFGLSACWLASMALAVACFVWAAALGPGDAWAFALVCAGSGFALGADVAVPNAMLTGVIQRCGHGAKHDGRFVGWWTAATKLNLALAAGLALPTLAWFGYQPGERSDTALAALALAYCAWPCALKACAAGLLWHWRRQASYTE